MLRKVSSKWVEVWGAEQIQNQILKGLLTLCIALLVAQTIAVCFLSLRPPVLIGVTHDKSQVLAVTPPGEELLASEVNRVVKAYIELHHSWNWETVDEHLENASKLVGVQFRDKFLQANAAQAKIAKDKKLSQTVYVSKIDLDPKQQSATVHAERVIVVEGLRAASPITVRVGYEMAARTSANPEGIYITSEDLVPQSTNN